jgi:predicted Ser/Thr protein kinase
VDDAMRTETLPKQTETLQTGDDTPWSKSDFEHRRSVAAVRMALFGKGQTLAIGRYRIERRIGAGGMGEVYLGLDAALGRKAAIKRVPPERSTSESPERLRKEARALARLSHPNVVQIYEVGEHEDQTFLAMEYVEGTTLTGWLKDARSWQEILSVFVAAGRGLAAAHSAGVIHRDFKPDNVLISKAGRVCVADFGLAVADEDGAHRHEVSGTVRYMSLEQLRGEDVDARSDQFSFCVALYEALWQTEPFDRTTVAARVRALQFGRPRPPPPGAGARARSTLAQLRGAARGPAGDPDPSTSTGGARVGAAALAGRSVVGRSRIAGRASVHGRGERARGCLGRGYEGRARSCVRGDRGRTRGGDARACRAGTRRVGRCVEDRAAGPV